MAFTPINAGPSPSGGKVAIALFEKRLPLQVQLDTPKPDEICTPDHNPLEQMYGARETRHDAVISLGDIAATTLLLFEHAVTADYSPEIEALRWRGKYFQLTALIKGVEDRPSFAATRPGAIAVDLAATVG